MKISVVGGGNAGCFTALQFGWHSDYEVELIYNPKIKPERVGQATLLDPPELLWAATGFNWYHNPIHATMKSGILYEGWGKVNDEVFHAFPADKMAMHYCPWEMQKHVLQSGHFKVIETDVEDINNVDADYVFDCRGKPKDFTDYEDLKNPINACILAKPNWDVSKNPWSRHVATPDGWTFVIPTKSSSPSYDYCVGYCYNSDITSKGDAEKTFIDMFDVQIKKHLGFKNYVAKYPVIDNRIVLNGNRLFFLEPLESSATQTYIEWTRYILDCILHKEDPFKNGSGFVRNYIKETQNFVLWHYHYGSKYNTPFWNYARTLCFEDKNFDKFLKYSKETSFDDIMPVSYGGCAPNILYGQWNPWSFKVWYDGMIRAHS